MEIQVTERNGNDEITKTNSKQRNTSFSRFDGARRGNEDGAAAWILRIRNTKGEVDKISHGGKVLRDTSAMTAEREALRISVQQLKTLLPVETRF